ncbi:Hypothetical_protein [Hexamita inflata]|uniref:Hypothetical_protein n=1 Tax=Hexamita inflata TaxID=28002 RepID=A0ABP1GEH5_9EUKA
MDGMDFKVKKGDIIGLYTNGTTNFFNSVLDVQMLSWSQAEASWTQLALNMVGIKLICNIYTQNQSEMSCHLIFASSAQYSSIYKRREWCKNALNSENVQYIQCQIALIQTPNFRCKPQICFRLKLLVTNHFHQKIDRGCK